MNSDSLKYKGLIETLIFFVALFFRKDRICFLCYIGIYIASERKNSCLKNRQRLIVLTPVN
jgi:hypothetical protein